MFFWYRYLNRKLVFPEANKLNNTHTNIVAIVWGFLNAGANVFFVFFGFSLLHWMFAHAV